MVKYKPIFFHINNISEWTVQGTDKKIKYKIKFWICGILEMTLFNKVIFSKWISGAQNILY